MIKIIKTQKVCNVCQVCKPVEDYKTGRGTCIPCYNQVYRQKYQLNKEVVKEKSRLARLAKKQAKLNAIGQPTA